MISREFFIIRGVLNSMELRFESITQFSSRQEVKPFQAGATSWQCAAWVRVGCGWGAGGTSRGLRKLVSRFERQAGGRIHEEDGKHSRKRGRMWAEPSLGEVHRGLIVSRWD